MAIIPTTKTTIARYAAGLYGVKLGGQTLAAVVEDVQFNTANGVSGLNTVLNSYYAPFAGMTSAQVAAIVVANAGVVEGRYGLTAANVADAVSVVTAELNSAAPIGNQGAAIANVLAAWSNNFTEDPVFGAAARAWNLKIAQANTYATGAGSEDVAFGEVNTEFNLTTGADKLTGTEGDDTFTAVLGSLDNTDVINGGGGFDMLKAQVNGVIAPTIKDVEHLQFQAQFNTTDNADNNLGDTQIVKVDFNTNVTNVTGFNVIENNNSRTDLIIEDVRIANNQVTKDITIVMRETDPGNVDYGVYFDQNSLRNVSTSSSQINLRVLDTYATSLGLAPLKDSPYGAFTFSYSLNGAAPVSIKLESQAIQDAQTFPEMVAALQAAADGVFGAGTVTVSTGATYTVPDSVTGAQVQGTEIVLAARGNIEFSTPAGSGWLATDVVPAISGLHTSYTVGGATATELVTSTIILDDVGRGSTGGDLVVGGMSVGETSTSKGVEKFLIEVQDNSKLQTINSTNNTLREVVIVNGVTTRVNNAYNENEKDAGSLTVRGFEQPNDGAGNNALPGVDTLLGAGINHGQYGFTDVRVIDGSAMTGKLNFDAQITARSIAKYLNLKDGAPAQPAADNQAFTYSGGANNDTISVVVDGDVLASRSLSGREDFSFTANGGAGNDDITVSLNSSTTSTNWLADQQQLNNLFINGGDGNDTIRKPGNGNAKIDAGAGNDTVYAENTGMQVVTVGAGTENHRATWLVNANNADLNDLQGAITTDPSVFLYKGKLTVTFAGLMTGAAAAANANGYEVTVDIPTGNNYAVTQYHVNQAIKAAINGNAVLNKLLVAEDGPAATLVIKSLIDGTAVAGDLNITASASDFPAAGAELTSVTAAYKAYVNDLSVALPADQAANLTTLNGLSGLGTNQKFAQVAAIELVGANGTAHSDNVILLGAGDDVAVLGTSTTSNDTLVYQGYGQGKDTIVNFVAGTLALNSGQDKLDFSAYLDGKLATTGAKVALTYETGTTATADANEVIVLTGFVAGSGAKSAQTFADLTGDKLLAAIKETGTVDYGSITANTLNAGTFAGTTGKSVVLIENSANLGEYAAFELSFGTVAGAAEFTNAQLIGVMDFGASQAFDVTNFVI